MNHSSMTADAVSDRQLVEWMKVALASGREGVQRGETPFGAAVCRPDGELISVACNTVTSTHNPSAHAEVNAIAQACISLANPNLSEHWLIATAEPCPMCLATAAMAGIQYIAYGAGQAVVDEAGYASLGISARELAKLFTSEQRLRGPILGNECVSFLLENRSNS